MRRKSQEPEPSSEQGGAGGAPQEPVAMEEPVIEPGPPEWAAEVQSLLEEKCSETVGELRAVNQLEGLRSGGRIERASFSAAYQPLLCALAGGASGAQVVPAVCAPSAN